MYIISHNYLSCHVKYLISVHIMSKAHKIISPSCFLEKAKYITKCLRGSKFLFCNKVLIWLRHQDQSKNWIICFSDPSLWLAALIIIKYKNPHQRNIRELCKSWKGFLDSSPLITTKVSYMTLKKNYLGPFVAY